MPKRWAKRVAIIFGILVLLPLSGLVAWAVVGATEETAFEVPSPDGRYVAWVAVWRTDLDTSVLVRDLADVDSSGHAASKRLMQIRGGVRTKSGIDLIWKDERTLVIDYFYGAKVFAIHEEPWHDISIVLHERERPVAPRRP